MLALATLLVSDQMVENHGTGGRRPLEMTTFAADAKRLNSRCLGRPLAPNEAEGRSRSLAHCHVCGELLTSEADGLPSQIKQCRYQRPAFPPSLKAPRDAAPKDLARERRAPVL